MSHIYCMLLLRHEQRAYLKACTIARIISESCDCQLEVAVLITWSINVLPSLSPALALNQNGITIS